MLILLVVLIALMVFEIKFHKWNSGYIDRGQTGAIKGVCAVLILLSHLFQYITPAETGTDKIFYTVLGLLGQLTVAPFMFLSGYGIHHSVLHSKDGSYFKGFFKKRILKTLFRFDVAVLIYVVLNLCLHIQYPIQNYILCWIGWEGIGNSSWFVFAILCLYLLTLVSFKICKNYKGLLPVLLVMGMTVMYCVAIRFTRSDVWWYDTVLCFPAGMLFSLYQKRIEMLYKKCYWIVLIAMVITFVVLFYLKEHLSYWLFLPMAVLFCLLLTTLNVKVRVCNPILEWLGKRSFSIFILQRIPMILLSEKGWGKNNIVFSLICIGTTLILAELFDRAVDALTGRLFDEKRSNKTQNKV